MLYVAHESYQIAHRVNGAYVVLGMCISESCAAWAASEIEARRRYGRHAGDDEGHDGWVRYGPRYGRNAECVSFCVELAAFHSLTLFFFLEMMGGVPGMGGGGMPDLAKMMQSMGGMGGFPGLGGLGGGGGR